MADYYGVTPQQILDMNPGLVVFDDRTVKACACVIIPSHNLDVSHAHIYTEMPTCATPNIASTPESVQTTNGIVTVTPASQPTTIPTLEIHSTSTVSIEQQIIDRLNNPMCGLEPTQYTDIVPIEIRLIETQLQQLYMGASSKEQSLFSEVFAEHFACNSISPTVFDGQQNPIGISHVRVVLDCINQANNSDVIDAHDLRSELDQATWVREQCAAIKLYDENGNQISSESGGVKSIFDLMNEAARQAYEVVVNYRREKNIQASTGGGTFQQDLRDNVQTIGVHPAVKVIVGIMASLAAVPTVGNAIYHTIDKFSKRSSKFGFLGASLVNIVDWTANGIYSLWEAMKSSKEVEQEDEN